MNAITVTETKGVLHAAKATLGKINNTLEWLAPAGDLILRGWVAYAFFVSGLTKIQTWDSTLYLFNDEYHVPLLPPELAAYLGTATELGFPVLLTLGLCGRFAAFALFIFNIIAVVSYPDLGAAGLEQHKTWGIMLLVCLLHGPGKLSADNLINKVLHSGKR